MPEPRTTTKRARRKQVRPVAAAPRETLFESIQRARAKLDCNDLRGPDPWADVRDKTPGRVPDLG